MGLHTKGNFKDILAYTISCCQYVFCVYMACASCTFILCGGFENRGEYRPFYSLVTLAYLPVLVAQSNAIDIPFFIGRVGSHNSGRREAFLLQGKNRMTGSDTNIEPV